MKIRLTMTITPTEESLKELLTAVGSADHHAIAAFIGKEFVDGFADVTDTRIDLTDIHVEE